MKADIFIINNCCVDYNFLYCVVFGTQCDVFSKDGVRFTLHVIPLNLLLENTGSVLLDVMGKQMATLSLLDFRRSGLYLQHVDVARKSLWSQSDP